jgi:hypothetical protein
MRRLTSITITLALLLVSGAAGAAGGDKSSGKGASGPPAGGESPGGGKSESVTEGRDTRGADSTVSSRVWEVGLNVEYHHTVDPDYITNGVLRNVMYYQPTARWDISPYDRISFRYGVFQYFLADNGESGVRSDDISLTYTRRIPLPGEVTLRVAGRVTIPVSYSSQLGGLYSAPRLSLGGERRFGKYFTLDLRLLGTFFIVKSPEGGFQYHGGGESGAGALGQCSGLGCNGGGANPSAKAAFEGVLSGELAMPFHEPLSVGLSVYTGYTWYYDVSNGGGCPPGTPSTPCMYGTVMQPTKQQPIEQAYGGEVYIKYAFPTVGGFKSDLTVAYAPNGDPTMGYASVLNTNGVAHVYPFYFRETSEVYFTLGGRY